MNCVEHGPEHIAFELESAHGFPLKLVRCPSAVTAVSAGDSGLYSTGFEQYGQCSGHRYVISASNAYGRGTVI